MNHGRAGMSHKKHRSVPRGAHKGQGVVLHKPKAIRPDGFNTSKFTLFSASPEMWRLAKIASRWRKAAKAMRLRRVRAKDGDTSHSCGVTYRFNWLRLDGSLTGAGFDRICGTNGGQCPDCAVLATPPQQETE